MGQRQTAKQWPKWSDFFRPYRGLDTASGDWFFSSGKGDSYSSGRVTFLSGQKDRYKIGRSEFFPSGRILDWLRLFQNLFRQNAIWVTGVQSAKFESTTIRQSGNLTIGWSSHPVMPTQVHPANQSYSHPVMPSLFYPANQQSCHPAVQQPGPPSIRLSGHLLTLPSSHLAIQKPNHPTITLYY